MLLIDIAAAPDLPVLKASRRDINRNLFVGIGEPKMRVVACLVGIPT